MGESFLEKNNSAGIKLNNIIEEFKYIYKSQEIKAGDFVNYVNGVANRVSYGNSVDTAIVASQYAGYNIAAVLIDSDTVFIAHSYNTSYGLYCTVCKISGATITCGTPTNLNSIRYAGRFLKAIKLDDGRIFIAHSYSSNYHLYGMLVNVDGLTVTYGADTPINDYEDEGAGISLAKLENNRIFVSHNYRSSDRLYGRIVTISGDTMDIGTDTAVAAPSSLNTYCGRSTSTIAVSNENVFVAHSYASNYYLYGTACTVSGSVITAGEYTKINGSVAQTAAYIDTILVDSGDVLIVHSHTKSSYYLYGIVCTVNGTSFSKGTDTALDNTTTYSGMNISTTKLDNGNIFIAHAHTSSYHLYGAICTVSNKVITLLSNTMLSDTAYSAMATSVLLLGNNKLFLAHSYSSEYHRLCPP